MGTPLQYNKSPSNLVPSTSSQTNSTTIQQVTIKPVLSTSSQTNWALHYNTTSHHQTWSHLPAARQTGDSTIYNESPHQLDTLGTPLYTTCHLINQTNWALHYIQHVTSSTRQTGHSTIYNMSPHKSDTLGTPLYTTCHLINQTNCALHYIQHVTSSTTQTGHSTIYNMSPNKTCPVNQHNTQNSAKLTFHLTTSVYFMCIYSIIDTR